LRLHMSRPLFSDPRLNKTTIQRKEESPDKPIVKKLGQDSLMGSR